MSRPTSAHLEALPWLDFIAAGGQSHVFGTSDWILKIPRWSWSTACGRVLVHPTTPVRALEVLGGLIEPFALLPFAAFRGPCVVHGSAQPSTSRIWNARWAVAAARQPAGDFLDQRIARATPGEAARLISALLDTLEAIRARGWHVIDFIMSNFVVDAAGGVRLVDTGLLIPVAHLRGPSHQICSRLFVRRMIPDYRQVLSDVSARHPDDAAGNRALRCVMQSLEPRLRAWRAGALSTPEATARPAVARLSPALNLEIFNQLDPVRYKLPLTAYRPSGYTAGHHAIASKN